MWKIRSSLLGHAHLRLVFSKDIQLASRYPVTWYPRVACHGLLESTGPSICVGISCNPKKTLFSCSISCDPTL